MNTAAVYTVELESGDTRATYCVTAGGRNGAVVLALARAFKAHPLVIDWRPGSVERARGGAVQTRIDAPPEPVQAPEPAQGFEQEHLFTARPMPAGQISMGGIE